MMAPGFSRAVVYSMGKVASTSVVRSLKAAGVPCVGLHSLDQRYLQRTAWQHLWRGRRPPGHIRTALRHRRAILRRDPDTLFISLVRDPLTRNLSAFFENLSPRDLETATPPALWARFVQDYRQTTPLGWFDREFRAQLGIDIYAHGFDPAARYAVLPKARTVLFRTDCPDATKAAVLSDLLGRPITLARANVAAEKPYAAHYRAVRQIARFDPALVAQITEARFTRHFWTPAERTAMAATWAASAG